MTPLISVHGLLVLSSSLCLTLAPQITACQAPLPAGSSRQEYHWSGVPFLIPGSHHDPGIEPTSLASPALAGRFFTASAV